MIFTKLEKVIILYNFNYIAENVGPFSINLIFFLKKLLGSRRIVALVNPLVDFTLVKKSLQNLPDNSLVAILGCTNVIVVGNGQLLEKGEKFLGYSVATFLGINPLRTCSSLNLLPMFVQASKEKGLLANQALMPRYDIGQNLFICMPQMRRSIGIVDSRS